MLLSVILIFCFGLVTANYDLLNTYFGDSSIYDGNETILGRHPREDEVFNKNFKYTRYSCEHMSSTEQTPFVVLMLYRTSGRFLGMGSIISSKTVLTAGKVVENTMQNPNELLSLAGRLGPWWGKGSQVKEAEEIFVNDKSLALVNLKHGFIFNRNVAPIKLAEKKVEDYIGEYTEDNAIFGVTRSSWDIPGDKTAKSARYIMKVETIREMKNGLAECKTIFPDHDYDGDFHYCTSANGTFCWGCIGSPAIAITSSDAVLQIAVVTKTTQLSDVDKYHIHTKIGPYIIWLKSHSHLEYPAE